MKLFSQLREEQVLIQLYSDIQQLSEDTIINLLEDESNDSEFREVLYQYAIANDIVEEVYFGDMSVEMLYSLVSENNVPEHIVANAIITLFEKNEIVLSEQELYELVEAAQGTLPSYKSTAVARPSSTSIGPVNKPMKDMGWVKAMSSPKLSAPAVGSVAKTTLKDVAKSALGAAGRLVNKYSPHVAALGAGYEAGKALNKASSTVSGYTDKLGKSIAGGLQKIGIGASPEVVKAKSPTSSYKPQSTAPQTSVPAKSGGGIVTFPKPASSSMGTAAKPASSSMGTAAKPASSGMGTAAKPTSSGMGTAAKPTTGVSSVRKSMPFVSNMTKSVSPSIDMDDLRASAAKMKSATTGLTAQTGKAVSALQKIAPSARSERPTSPGGISSTSIHKDIAALGGEPTKPVSGSNQPAKPPQLSASSLKKNPSAGGGRWM